MAQLKDLIVSGASRLIGDTFATSLQTNTLKAPTTAGGTTYGPGTNGYVLKSNGTNIYWGADNNTTYTLAGLMGSAAKGSATQPVYWSGSAWTNTTYTLGASVPSNAKFTDTTYSAATTSAAGLMSAADKSKLDGIAAEANKYTLPAATASALGGIMVTPGNGLTYSSNKLSMTAASASAAGAITTGVQTLAGNKTFSGNTTLNGTTTFGNNLFLTGSAYGQELPTTGTEGQVFFQLSDEYREIPSGGTVGQMLVKTDNSDYVYDWQTVVALPTGGTAGQVLSKIDNTDGNAQWVTTVSSATNATNATNIYSSASTSKAYVLGTTTASSANHATVYNASVYTEGAVLYGAAWNDYAEYREANSLEPGRCIVENGDDTLSLSTARMQPGAEIISDTFGFAIGETDECKTPIAATGRVLAYTYEDREEYRKAIGRPVCSGPNGTVSIMTDEEYAVKGYCCIGFISAVPDYEEWGTGNIKVNGRIWIRVR